MQRGPSSRSRVNQDHNIDIEINLLRNSRNKYDAQKLEPTITEDMHHVKLLDAQDRKQRRAFEAATDGKVSPTHRSRDDMTSFIDTSPRNRGGPTVTSFQ